jgi:hypothetical protein
MLFVNDLQQVCSLIRVLWFPPTIKLTRCIQCDKADRHNVIENGEECRLPIKSFRKLSLLGLDTKNMYRSTN